MPQTPTEAIAVVEFWRKAGRDKWFETSATFDDEFRQRYLGLHQKAAAGDLRRWSETPEGSLALLLLLDQFPRNCFRGMPRVYATDPLAREAAREALEKGHDLAVDQDLRVFFYLPFAHSENLADQEINVEKNILLGDDYVKYAVRHRDIIRRFGRFPHRNVIVGRDTTPEEQQFLDDGGFAG